MTDDERKEAAAIEGADREDRRQAWLILAIFLPLFAAALVIIRLCFPGPARGVRTGGKR